MKAQQAISMCIIADNKWQIEPAWVAGGDSHFNVVWLLCNFWKRTEKRGGEGGERERERDRSIVKVRLERRNSSMHDVMHVNN